MCAPYAARNVDDLNFQYLCKQSFCRNWDACSSQTNEGNSVVLFGPWLLRGNAFRSARVC